MHSMVSTDHDASMQMKTTTLIWEFRSSPIFHTGSEKSSLDKKNLTIVTVEYTQLKSLRK